MFVLITYDVPADRTRIYRKLLRKHLEHIQYSVFHGDITAGQLVTITQEIETRLEEDDSIYIFQADVSAAVECTVLGDAAEPGRRFT
ncbi:CRISPR-associated endonuclease Cas2 [Natrinema altunense]|uniref:CRISPR-associated endoribonuclease Cas2 n=1 Tax=Natrinema altunense TaxID=222984 RepID=A0A482Y2C3_9EURY|nr:CRISPR-associated endonuclease Cas2 [Natrinema altunense]RZH69010.1 CRISPR-associated endonuclease Cas2 [Natrinema altunense]